MDNESRDLELEKQIDDYLKGKLGEEEGQKLWEELLKKPEYIDFLNTELAAKSIYGESTSSTLSLPKDKDDFGRGGKYSRQGSWKWIAAAAAIVLLAVAIKILQVGTSQKLQKAAINEINIVGNLASAPVVRSQAANLSKADSLLNAGFNVAIAGNSSQAISIYNQIIEHFANQPAAMKAYLNKGILQYNAGDFTHAAHSFTTILPMPDDQLNGNIKEKASWYLGNAYLKMGKLQQARKAVHNVYTLDGNYREKAHRLLQKIDRKLSNADDDSDSQENESE